MARFARRILVVGKRLFGLAPIAEPLKSDVLHDSHRANARTTA
jgi:hypothetical protein